MHAICGMWWVVADRWQALIASSFSAFFAAIEAAADRLEAEGMSSTGSEPSTQVNHPALSCSHAVAQGQAR